LHWYDWNFMPDGRDVPGHGFWALMIGEPHSSTLFGHSAKIKKLFKRLNKIIFYL
jgi:hypothetical protein